jgi:hypothetical protein
MLALHAISCKCSDAKKPSMETIQQGSLLIDVTSHTLVDNQKTIEAIFTLGEVTKTALLENFMIKVSYIEGAGKLSYTGYGEGAPTVKEVSALEERLNYFTTSTVLSLQNNLLKVPITFVPDLGVNHIKFKLELLNTLNNSTQDIEVTWTKTQQPFHLVLTHIGATTVKGKTPIQLQISNKGIKPIEVSKLQLRATRVAGQHASIEGATKQNNDTYVLTLSELAFGKDITQDILINFGADAKAKFMFQLIYDGHKIGDPVEINGKKGIPLLLKHIHYNKHTRQITYTIKNVGNEPVRQVKLCCKNKTAGIQLAGVDLVNSDMETTLEIADRLAPGEKKKNQSLGELDFGANKEANFEFMLLYEGNSIPMGTYTFMLADVVLALELKYNKLKSELTYIVSNTGKEEAKNVQLKVKNISTDKDECTVTLQDDKANLLNTLAIGDIVALAGSSVGKAYINFIKQDKATFEFELVSDGIVIEQAKVVQEFKALPVKLQLFKIVSSNVFYSYKAADFELKGKSKEINLSIQPKDLSRDLASIDFNKLRLFIVNETGNDAVISSNPGGASVTQLAGNALLNNGNLEVQLFVVPGTAKQAKFRLQLEYKEENHGDPLFAIWEEEQLEIHGLNKFIGNNTATFRLVTPINSFININTDDITIEITSDNKATFKLLGKKVKDAGTSALLSNLIDFIGDDSIGLQLDAANNEKNAHVTVLIRRNDVLLASQTVIWEAVGTSVYIKLPENYVFSDQNIYSINLINKGTIATTEKIKVRCTNDKGVKIKLGTTLIGDKIETNLKVITGQEELPKDIPVTINIQEVENPQHVYAADLTLEFLDEIGNIVGKVNVEWEDEKEILNHIFPLVDKLIALQAEFTHQEKNISDSFDNNKFDEFIKAIKEIFAISAKVIQTRNNLESLSLDKMNGTGRKCVSDKLKDADRLIKDIEEFVPKYINACEDDVESLLEEIPFKIEFLNHPNFKTNLKSYRKRQEGAERVKVKISEILYDFKKAHQYMVYITGLSSLFNNMEGIQLAEQLKITLQQTMQNNVADVIQIAEYFRQEAINTVDVDNAYDHGSAIVYEVAQGIMNIAEFTGDKEYDKIFYMYAAQAWQYTAEAMLAVAEKENGHIYNIFHESWQANKAAEQAINAAAHISINTKDNNRANQAAKTAILAAIKTW